MNAEQINTVREKLVHLIPDDIRRTRILSELVVAIILSRSNTAKELAPHIVRDVNDESIAQMVRRFMKNEHIRWETHYLPVIQHVIGQLSEPVWYLSVDTTDLGSKHRALVISLVLHERCLPLIWQVEPGSKGHTKEAVQVELLKKLGQYVNFQGTVVFLGDSEFDGVQLQAQLRQQEWHYILRTSPHRWVYPRDEPAYPLGQLVPYPEWGATEIPAVYFGKAQQFGPVDCFTTWEAGHTAPLVLIAHLPPDWDASIRATYKYRHSTEPLFGDQKENGFRLNTSRIRHADRLGRLFLVAAIAYLWMLAVGFQIVGTKLATKVDRANRRTLSIFKTGWRFFKRELKFQRRVDFALLIPATFVLPELKYTRSVG